MAVNININTRRRRKFHHSTLIGLGLLVFMWMIALFGPLLTPYDPIATSSEWRLPPSLRHWLGTDYAGRDILTRLIYSIRLAYLGGLGSMAIFACLGSFLGLLAGYHGGRTDTTIIYLIDLWLIIPELLILVILIAILGQGIWQIIVAIGIVGIAPCTHIVRGLTLYERNQSYIEAARALGTPLWRILCYHILPNISPALATFLAARFGNAILALSGLSFLGIGIPAPIPELGNLLNYGQEVMIYAWWVLLGPILVLWITIFGVSLISDGLSEHFH